MKMKNKNKKILILLIVMLILVNLFMCVNHLDFGKRLNYKIEFNKNGYNINSIEYVCRNLNFEETSYCLNTFVRGIFNYNESSNPENFEELINSGGVCRHYSEFYKYYLERFGFESNEIDFYWNDNKIDGWGDDNLVIYLGDGYLKRGHVYTYGYDKESRDKIVCFLDQKYINCREFN